MNNFEQRVFCACVAGLDSDRDNIVKYAELLEKRYYTALQVSREIDEDAENIQKWRDIGKDD